MPPSFIDESRRFGPEPRVLPHRNLVRVLALLVVFALVGAACSSSDSADSNTEDAAETTSESGETGDATADGQEDGAAEEEGDGGAILLPQDEPLSSAPGVDAETIRIGVLIRDVNQLIGTGFVEDLTVTQQVDRWRAEAARINSEGGVAGRDLEIVVATWDPLIPESLLTACDRIAETRDAFVVLNTSGLETLAPDCLTEPHNRPVLVGESPTLADFDQAGGLLFSIEPPREVLLRTAIQRFEAAEMLSGRIAVVHADLDGDIETADLAMSMLSELGYVVSRQTIPASQGVESALETMPDRVNELISDRTDTVVMLSNSTIAQALGEEMNRYGADWANLIVDVDNIVDPFAASRLGSAWDGAFAVSTYGGVTLRQVPVEADCRRGWDAYLNGEYNERPRGDWSTSAGLETRSTRGAAPDSVDPPGDIGYTECLMMHLVSNALNEVPLNFTVQDFVQALESGPRVTTPLGGSGSFKPDEHWLADRAAIVQFLRWDSGFCPTPQRDCFVPLNGDRSSFRPLADLPPAEDSADIDS